MDPILELSETFFKAKTLPQQCSLTIAFYLFVPSLLFWRKVAAFPLLL